MIHGTVSFERGINLTHADQFDHRWEDDSKQFYYVFSGSEGRFSKF